MREHGHTCCWICMLAGLAASLLLATPARAQPQVPQVPQVIVAAQVVTAPWAAPSQAPGARVDPREASAFTPPPLLSTPVPPPLSEEARRTLQATRSENLPEPTWLRYVVSNEWRHDITFPRIAGLGGAYIGVATDQNYTLAAAARSELIFLFDYDAEVGRVHRIYHAFMARAATPAEFRAFFEPGQVARGKEVLGAAATSPRDAAKLQWVYEHYRDRLQVYLRHVANLRVGERHPTWLGDPAAYAYVRGLVLGGRVITVQGDLNGAVALKSIGETARALKIPVRIVYTSNAEGFFRYTPAFRDNLAALPHDGKSIVLRTYKHRLASPVGDMWHYDLHQIDDFLARINQPALYPSVHQVMGDLRTKEGQKALDPLGVSYYDASVPMKKPAAPASR